ncbi:hypothetical protein HID58_053903, partial [Brassica napus]
RSVTTHLREPEERLLLTRRLHADKHLPSFLRPNHRRFLTVSRSYGTHITRESTVKTRPLHELWCASRGELRNQPPDLHSKCQAITVTCHRLFTGSRRDQMTTSSLNSLTLQIRLRFDQILLRRDHNSHRERQSSPETSSISLWNRGYRYGKKEKERESWRREEPPTPLETRTPGVEPPR